METKLIIKKISPVTEKGNVTLQLTYKKGIAKNSRPLFLLVDADDANGLKEGDDIASMIPANFKTRESVWADSEGEEQTTVWIEL